jgi:DNA-binding MarR family transcriptional regulator
MPSPARDEVPLLTSVLDDLRRIVRVLRESSRASEGALGVTGAQLFVLKSLSGSEPLCLNDVAARTRTHQSTVSVVVKRLVERGLVKRSASALDLRRVEFSLTRSGRSLLARAPRLAQDRLIEGVLALRPARRRALAATLHELVAAMQLGGEPPSMFFEGETARRPQPRRSHAARR